MSHVGFRCVRRARRSARGGCVVGVDVHVLLEHGARGAGDLHPRHPVVEPAGSRTRGPAPSGSAGRRGATSSRSPPAQIARYYATIEPDLGKHDVRTSTRHGGRPGTYELLVVAADRPGLLSWIAGALSSAGLSILTAQVFTTEDGVAADLFEVQGVFEPVVGEERWREFRGLLRKAIDGRVSLEHRMTEKRRHYPERSDTPVTVAVDNDASDFFTVIEIGAPDRIGLLYDITRTLSDLELDVHLAKVATYTDRVIDAFYVRDALGRKVLETADVASAERSIRALLE